MRCFQNWMVTRFAGSLCLVAPFASVTSAASVIYQADFSQIVSIDHTSTGNALEPSPQFGANFSIGYPSPPSSDTTRNFFETDGGSLISSDFGGAHFMKSFDIDVSGWDEITIDILADFVGTDSFNNSPTEFIEYFFTQDNGAENPFFHFTDDPNGPNLNASTTVDVTAVSTLAVGLNAWVDGAGDGFDMTSLVVEGTIAAIPEPSALALVGLGALGTLVRRHK